MKTRCLRTVFSDIPVYTFSLKIKDLITIQYVAVRGQDKEEGAVQRVLNRGRIISIKEFVENGNMFFNTFILNWTEKQFGPEYSDGYITVPIKPAAAQVIDGQHRLAGLEEAMKAKSAIGEQRALVSLCLGLTTKQAATIFLNINSEQKPVPRSLIYDLFGIVEDDINLEINRANDIAHELNDNNESPYYNYIKFPGTPRGAGLIDLSTVVSSLKKHLSMDGTFSKVNIRSLNNQKQTILNFFKAIESYYEKAGTWHDRSKNPFLKSSGFNGAVDFLVGSMLTKCVDRKSFTVETMKSILALDKSSLLSSQDIKHFDGKTARKRVNDFLDSANRDNLPAQDEYAFE
jgi:DGQHR domain-containing protein